MATYARTPIYSAIRTSDVVWWPIGTSITQGILGGYRATTFPFLAASGKNPTTVGGLLTSTYGGDPALCGTHHNGNAGSTVANWIASYYATYVAGLQATPNLITIELGANDADSEANGTKVGGDMVDLAASSFPRASILVFLATDRAGAALSTMNAAITAAVATRKTKGYNVDTVDMRSVQPPQLDGVHPNLYGYGLMGSCLNAVLSRFL